MLKFNFSKKIVGVLLFFVFSTLTVVSIFTVKVYGVFAESYVANVVIFSSAGKDSFASSGSSVPFGDLGHAFILVENNSKSDILVGKMTIRPNESVTVGTWGNQNGHKGIWYNLESYAINTLNVLSNRVSIEEKVTADKLQSINTYIKGHDKWEIFKNCSTFATGLWNSFSSTKLSCGWVNTPANLMNSIKKNNYSTKRNIALNTKVGYYSGDTFKEANSFAVAMLASFETSFTEDSYEAIILAEGKN